MQRGSCITYFLLGRWCPKPLLAAEHEAGLGAAGIELVVANGVAAD